MGARLWPGFAAERSEAFRRGFNRRPAHRPPTHSPSIRPPTRTGAAGMPTQPNPTATSSTFQIGTYTSLTDTFTSVFDFNDGVTCSIQWNTLRMPQPQKAL